MKSRRAAAAAGPRCDRLLAVDPLGTPVEHCWRAAGHPDPCPHPTRGNAVHTTGGSR